MAIKKRRSYHLVNQQDFSTVKMLLDAGLSVSKVRVATGKSFGVIGLIKKSNTLNDYRNSVHATVQKYAKPAVKVVHEEVEETVKEVGTTSEVVKELRNINATLERLAIAWESRPAKRGLFDR